MHSMMANDVIIVQGETGSGKTTRVPLWACEELKKEKLPGKVYCTQPR